VKICALHSILHYFFYYPIRLDWNQRCPTSEKNSPQMWRQKHHCRHISCKRHFQMEIRQEKCFQYWASQLIYHLNGSFFQILLKSNIIYLKVVLNTASIQKYENIPFIPIFKIVSLSPHLKCLSPHVAIGDKVGQRCSKWRLQSQIVYLFFLNRLTSKEKSSRRGHTAGRKHVVT